MFDINYSFLKCTLSKTYYKLSNAIIVILDLESINSLEMFFDIFEKVNNEGMISKLSVIAWKPKSRGSLASAKSSISTIPETISNRASDASISSTIIENFTSNNKIISEVLIKCSNSSIIQKSYCSKDTNHTTNDSKDIQSKVVSIGKVIAFSKEIIEKQEDNYGLSKDNALKIKNKTNSFNQSGKGKAKREEPSKILTLQSKFKSFCQVFKIIVVYINHYSEISTDNELFRNFIGYLLLKKFNTPDTSVLAKAQGKKRNSITLVNSDSTSCSTSSGNNLINSQLIFHQKILNKRKNSHK